MSYEEYENKIQKKLRVITLLSIGAVTLLLLALVLQSFTSYKLSLSAHEIEDKKGNPLAVCWHGFKSIVRKKANSIVVEKKYLRQLESADYSGIDLKEPKKNDLESIRLITKEKCRLIIKDNKAGINELPFRAFNIHVKEDGNYKLFFKVSGVFEDLLDEGEAR